VHNVAMLIAVTVATSTAKAVEMSLRFCMGMLFSSDL